MSHSVTYIPDDPTRSKIRILCIDLEQKPNTGLEHIYSLKRSKSESE